MKFWQVLAAAALLAACSGSPTGVGPLHPLKIGAIDQGLILTEGDTLPLCVFPQPAEYRLGPSVSCKGHPPLKAEWPPGEVGACPQVVLPVGYGSLYPDCVASATVVRDPGGVEEKVSSPPFRVAKGS